MKALWAALCVAFVAVWTLPTQTVTQPSVEVVHAADPPKKEEGKRHHGRGHKPPTKEVAEARHRISNRRFADLRKSIPVNNKPTYDARTLGVIPPVGNQGSCGDCYCWSGCKVCASAQMVAKVVPADGKFMIAPSYFLDCQSVGGCDGGDEYQVAQLVNSGGAPSLAQYEGDGQTPGKCKSTKDMTLYTVSSIVMVGSDTGIAATQDIKNYCAVYGYVSVAVAAGGGWWDSGTGTDTAKGTDIDHAVGIVGWDDTHDNGDGTKGAWIMQNNWDTTWGLNCANAANPTPTEAGGYGWMKYGADSIGTEAFVCIVASAPPVPPTPPTPPVPPVPPVPGAAPVISSPATASAVIGTPFSYQIVASNSPVAYMALGLPAGLTCDLSGAITGTPTTAGASSVTLLAANASGAGLLTLTLTVTATPINPVNITLTTDQITSILTQVGGVVVTESITLKQLNDIIAKKGGSPLPAVPPDQVAEIKKQLADQQRALEAIMKALMPPDKGEKPLPKGSRLTPMRTRSYHESFQDQYLTIAL